MKNKYFHKLQINWNKLLTEDFISNNIIKGQSVFYRTDRSPGYFRFNAVNNTVIDLALDSIPGIRELHPFVTYVEIECNPGEEAPHIDKMQNGDAFFCTINYYLSSKGMITNFYSIKPGANKLPILNLDSDSGYDVDGLDLQASFVAKDNDTYLLNINEVHSVTNPSSSKQLRKALSLKFFDKTFDEVLDFLTAGGS